MYSSNKFAYHFLIVLMILLIGFTNAQQGDYVWEDTTIHDEPLLYNFTRAHVFTATALHVKSAVGCSEFCNIYLILRAEYERMRSGQSFTPIKQLLNVKSGSLDTNDIGIISRVVLIVVFNPTRALNRLSYKMLQLVPKRAVREWRSRSYIHDMHSQEIVYREFNSAANEAVVTLSTTEMIQGMVLTFENYLNFANGRPYEVIQRAQGTKMVFRILDENILIGNAVVVVRNVFAGDNQISMSFQEHLPVQSPTDPVMIILGITLPLSIMICFCFMSFAIVLVIWAVVRRKRIPEHDHDAIYGL